LLGLPLDLLAVFLLGLAVFLPVARFHHIKQIISAKRNVFKVVIVIVVVGIVSTVGIVLTVAITLLDLLYANVLWLGKMTQTPTTLVAEVCATVAAHVIAPFRPPNKACTARANLA